jgi:poly-gamma-glutamate capsule biosynthesis protein CapA/YwtB (metallophosphatase superfamily)
VTLRTTDQTGTKDGRKQIVVSPLQLSSGDRATIKQGLYTLAKVEGVVFRDENANGVWDARETVLPNVKVTLYRVAEPADVVVSQMKSDEVRSLGVL